MAAKQLLFPEAARARNAGGEASVVLNRVDESKDTAFGVSSATRAYGGPPAKGVIDPAKVTRLALQNAASIASPILTTDCMIANEPKVQAAAAAGMGQGGESPAD